MSRGPQPGSTGRNKAEIAHVALAAHARGESMITALVAYYGCTRAAARAAISRTRLAGHPLPLGYHAKRILTAEQLAERQAAHEARRERRLLREARPPAPVERQPVRCACGLLLANRTTLGKHTWGAHDRAPSDRERIIIGEQVAA